MNRSKENLMKNRGKISTTIFVLMIVVSASIFPIVPTNIIAYDSLPLFMISLMLLLRIQMIYVCYLVGGFIRKLYPNRKSHVVITFFVMNLIGFSFRLWIEWGESSLMRDLTIRNIAIHLILIPLVIVVAYLRADE